jgi:hypothetical protein
VTGSHPRRICATEGCTTPLSKYNSGNHCYAHDDPRDEGRTNAYSFRIDKEIRDDRKLHDS